MKQLITDIQAEIDDAKSNARAHVHDKPQWRTDMAFLSGLTLAMKHVKFHVKQHDICCTKTEL